MSRAEFPVSAGIGAVAPGTFPVWRVCGVPGLPWSWRRVCLVLWPSYLMYFRLERPSSTSGWLVSDPIRTSGELYSAYGILQKLTALLSSGCSIQGAP